MTSSSNGPPAIMQSKCLVCDKPVNPFFQQVNDSRPDSPIHTSTYYDKRDDLQLHTPSSTLPPQHHGARTSKLFSNRPATSGPIGRSTIGGGGGGGGTSKLLKSATVNLETNILKHSMEYLPPVTMTTAAAAIGNNATTASAQVCLRVTFLTLALSSSSHSSRLV
jgi:hypothetical protein